MDNLTLNCREPGNKILLEIDRKKQLRIGYRYCSGKQSPSYVDYCSYFGLDVIRSLLQVTVADGTVGTQLNLPAREGLTVCCNKLTAGELVFHFSSQPSEGRFSLIGADHYQLEKFLRKAIARHGETSVPKEKENITFGL